MLVEGIIQRALNESVASNSSLQQAAMRLAGKRVAVRIQGQMIKPDWQFSFGEHGTINVLERWPVEADCALEGHVSQWIGMLRANDDASLDDCGLTIAGDVGVALRFARFCKALEFDWEAMAATRIGPVPARGISRFLTMTRSAATQFRDKSVRSLGEAIGQEWRVGVHRIEWEDFVAEANALEARVDALQKRAC